MRIVVVSGHYPPNFISGGSLQPQRLARGLRALGHDVSVYAGRMDDGAAPLRTWDEVDETGLPVRWIVTTPFEPWGERRNFDNPEVHADFAAHLERCRPDVVHLHDLQMLGGSLVRAAAASGARVVVTMHDFWWICARLFLVDRDIQPCPIVTSAGACACERDRRWRVDRARALAQELSHADLVLAPSASAARVLVANGVAPGRVEVDENGLPDAELEVPTTGAPPLGSTGGVRFTYAGGHHHLKGSLVLLRAAAALGRMVDPSGWQLTTYGIAGHEADVGVVDLDGLPVVHREPFAPEERAEVLAATDVLVLPSIMLETHSILVREALSRRIPVICTATLGPEEVVEHGVNGLVVPPGDVEALGRAMARVVDDPGLLASLREGAGALPPIRSLADQITSLEHRYRRLLEGSEGPAAIGAAAAPIRHVLFACGIEGAPLRYRARLPQEALALLGVASDVLHYRDPALLEAVHRTDVLYVYRVPATVQFLELVATAKARGIPVVFDVDDLIFDPDLAAEIPALQILSPEEAEGWLHGVRRYRTTMEHCDGYVGSTKGLVAHAAQVTGLPAAQFDNGVGVLLATASESARRARRSPGPVRVGYLSGTITHDDDWFWVEPAIVELLDRCPDVELWLAGHLPESEALHRFGDRVVRLPFTHWLALPNVLRDLDVNIAPLAPGSRFNEAKSAIKWLEAALVGTPTVASATEPFRDAIDDGVTGFVVSELHQWVAALERLVTDPILRDLMGLRARREALLRWSPDLQGRRFLEIIEAARGWRALAEIRPDVGWDPAIADEPYGPFVLEPYAAPTRARLVGVRDRGRARILWLVGRLRARLARDGVLRTAWHLLRTLPSRAKAAGRRIGGGREANRPASGALRRGSLASFAARGRRALRTHGVRGSIDLARPVVRHRWDRAQHVLRVWLERIRRRGG